MQFEKHSRTTKLDYLDNTGSELINGRFGLRCVREIGSGYAGTVYKCLRTNVDRSDSRRKPNWLAVKIMPKKKIKADVAEREIKLLRLVKGTKGVIEYITAVECLDSYLLVTELCNQGDLHSLLPYLDQANIMVRDYMRGVAQGLSRLHEKLIAHCDIKMRNIVVDGHNVPKIADFGFATLLPHRHAKISVCQGTKDYWAPEMWVSTPYYSPFKSDVYALALTFLGVCERRPIKRKDKDLKEIVSSIKDAEQKELFSGLLKTNPRDRSGLNVILTNIWMEASLTPPPSP